MKSIFSKKITPTTITTNVEKVTDPSLQELDWSLVFQICDVVNNTELGAKEARKLLQKKMLSTEPQTQVLALEVLDALSENCHNKFMPQLAAKSFAEDLDTLVSKTTDDRVHSKLVHCLQSWVGRFGADGSLAGVHRVYDKLMNGQPAQTAAGIRGGRGTAVGGFYLPVNRNYSQRQRQQQQQQPEIPHQPVDAMNDVLLAKNNAQLFSQTLSFTDPTQEDITKNELIQEFYGKCKMFQKIISGHLQTCTDSDIISSLLEANSELVTSFKAYDDMLERRAVSEATTNSETLHNRSTRQQAPLDEENNHTSSSTGAGESSSSSSGGIDAGQSGTGYQHHLLFSEAPSQQQQQELVNTSTTMKTNTNTEDPFDPFSDTNQAHEGHSSSSDAGHNNNNNNNNNTNTNTTANVNLPPPLTPQKMHQ
ncbi:hypothetical protein BDA99DRAFT_609524 [Phascolomyces articulosus]|uniref:TOM1-like protein 2 n=1 Tax=Phascolomyces articulosus TaxID=60185 RepID=A0AAD5P7Z8_9FUNG|nr:hypothetical protein BDA99DRAFT_609524 [Phascolomyces articulosus]